MASEYHCGSAGRRRAIVDQTGSARINAIDFLLVHDGPGVPDGLRQRLLSLRFFYPDGVDTLRTAHVRVHGGVRVIDPPVRWATRTSDFAPALDARLSSAEASFIAALRDTQPDPDQWLLVLLERHGDYSRYRLALRAADLAGPPPAGFDRVLSDVEFSFKTECASPFDCGEQRRDPCAGDAAIDSVPPLDYLARDFNSFRRLMFDRLAVTQPGEASADAASNDPVTLRSLLVELMAYSADRLAYQQDAVASEAYLGTARRRSSLRRHARLLDYPMHEGCNARSFVHLAIRDGVSLSPALAAGARFLTRVPEFGAVIDPEDLPEAEVSAPEVFESLHPLRIASHAHNQISFHSWGEADCCLPAGSTTATLVAGPGVALEPGDFLFLEAVRGGDSDQRDEPDPAHRHVVRLREVSPPFTDELLATRVIRVHWHEADALPFPLVITIGTSAAAVARGNIVLVDHGATVAGEELALEPLGNQGHLRARLARPGLTFRQRYDPLDTESAASSSLAQDPRAAAPVIALEGERERWLPQPDLLSSPASQREFVVEMESDGSALLRFGDGVHGRSPTVASSDPRERFRATYRVGTGEPGNVGAEAIAHLVGTLEHVSGALAAAILSVRNPLPAVGGVEPEPLEDVRLYAPSAFRRQERAVTPQDWGEVAGRFASVQRAAATVRWTGSFHTVFVSVDRRDGLPVDAGFKTDFSAFLERFRMTGYDLEVDGPHYVPLDIALTVCVDGDHFRDAVLQTLNERFSAGLQRDGTPGFFHPDRLSFGQSVYLSQIVALATSVPGVCSVDYQPRATLKRDDNRFKRWGRSQGDEIETGRITLGRLEIARCDNDPNLPDNGQIQFFMQGGA